MVHCHAAVCTIYPVWQLPTLYPVIDEACTAIIGRERARYNISIAALNETRLPDESQLEEKGAGYTFFWIGKPANDHRQA